MPILDCFSIFKIQHRGCANFGLFSIFKIQHIGYANFGLFFYFQNPTLRVCQFSDCFSIFKNQHIIKMTISKLLIFFYVKLRSSASAVCHSSVCLFHNDCCYCQRNEYLVCITNTKRLLFCKLNGNIFFVWQIVSPFTVTMYSIG